MDEEVVGKSDDQAQVCVAVRVISLSLSLPPSLHRPCLILSRHLTPHTHRTASPPTTPPTTTTHTTPGGGERAHPQGRPRGLPPFRPQRHRPARLPRSPRGPGAPRPRRVLRARERGAAAVRRRLVAHHRGARRAVLRSHTVLTHSAHVVLTHLSRADPPIESRPAALTHSAHIVLTPVESRPAQPSLSLNASLTNDDTTLSPHHPPPPPPRYPILHCAGGRVCGDDPRAARPDGRPRRRRPRRRRAGKVDPQRRCVCLHGVLEPHTTPGLALVSCITHVRRPCSCRADHAVCSSSPPLQGSRRRTPSGRHGAPSTAASTTTTPRPTSSAACCAASRMTRAPPRRPSSHQPTFRL